MERAQLLHQLREDTQNILQTVESQFVPLTYDQLSARPSPNRWSVLECLEHLNIADAHYLYQFSQKLPKAIPNDQAVQFRPGWLGSYFVKMIKPKPDGTIPSPMKTISKFVPMVTTHKDTMERFLADQRSLLNVLDQCAVLDLNKVKITSAIGPIVTFKLGDALRFLIGHNQRHILQAQNVLREITAVQEA